MRLSEAHSEAAFYGVASDLLDPEVAAAFTVVGEPLTKARARVVVKQGKARSYTPDATKAAQDRITAACLTSLGAARRSPAADTTFGVRAVFFRANRQRRDVDNMLKLVLDALTGVLWVDDSQVTEVIGRMAPAHPSDEPRTAVVVYPTGRVEVPTATCANCGGKYRTYQSWSARIFCSDECHLAWRRSRRTRTCEQCGGDYTQAKRDDRQRFCSAACRDVWQKGRPKPRTAT